ncbi:hypothetical protein SAMN05421678_102214 [Actinopolymorpha cephalotaxi]|uniref:Uncharacterized protein n=1 Tax=Actinopolymorpha cephalotaxi TaxID=504797 RepID=A0A1I2LME1_9ACTN|nr:hypothetical protein [Actinopolymorpha cephalotaxi]NYH81357.1 hypothetical protein [Actinopolymorpha cephalotaxi]SFF80425.1 hypothetical protein SAMN05421678_102214 [Actinopolymorpha cephalotaxi]
MRRVAPAVGLFLTAPLVAEFLLGNLPITLLVGLVLLAPLYGGGALLIREFVRRTGRGWPSILLLGLAYGVFEEGVTTQSLFNRNYVGAHLLDVGYVPALGIAVPWTLAVLALHTVWSISVPIGLVEAMVPERRTTPWLGKVGLTVTGVLFAFGSLATTVMQIARDPFVASVPQFAGVAVVVVATVVAAFLVRPSRTVTTVEAHVEAPAEEAGRRGPSAWLVGGLALVCGSAYRLAPGHSAAWVPVVMMTAIAGVAVAAVAYWSRRPGWAPRHQLALVAGAALAYALHAFIETPVLPVSTTIDHVGDVVFGAAAVVAILVAARRTRQSSASFGIYHDPPNEISPVG